MFLQFDRRPSEDLLFDVKYDISSIMHYSQKAFSQTDKPSIIALDERFQSSMGQSGSATFRDLQILNRAYCSPVTGDCKNGGYKNPANPDTCLCHEPFAGEKCEELNTDPDCGGEIVLSENGDLEEIAISKGKGGKCTWKITAPKG